MIQFYHRSGSTEIDLRDLHFTDEEWSVLRSSATRLLRRQGSPQAAELLERYPFRVYDGTNVFNDEFCVLFWAAPLDVYSELAEQEEDPLTRSAFRIIAETITQHLGVYIRFVAVALDATARECVPAPELRITSEAVDRALADAEQLLISRGPASAVDRVHTAFHGYLREIAQRAGISSPQGASITQVFSLIRGSHPSFASPARGEDVNRVARSMAAIIDAFDPIRNQASNAHPNEVVLGQAEAMLVINAVRTLLHYIDSRLGQG